MRLPVIEISSLCTFSQYNPFCWSASLFDGVPRFRDVSRDANLYFRKSAGCRAKNTQIVYYRNSQTSQR